MTITTIAKRLGGANTAKKVISRYMKWIDNFPEEAKEVFLDGDIPIVMVDSKKEVSVEAAVTGAPIQTDAKSASIALWMLAISKVHWESKNEKEESLLEEIYMSIRERVLGEETSESELKGLDRRAIYSMLG